MTYFEFTKRFPTEDAAIDYIVAKKYHDGYVCPKCGCVHHNIYHQSYDHRKLYCKNCMSEFSAFSGTIFENTHLDIRMWLYAMNLVIVAKKGISACQLQRELGMGSYHSAWRMMRMVRSAMHKEDMKEVFEAIVEIDETYVGGKPRKSNIHDDNDLPENQNKRGRGTSKTPVIGVKERSSGRVYCKVALRNSEGQQLTGKQLFSVLNKVCKGGNKVMTDQYSGYNILDGENEKNLVRLKVDHSVMFSLRNDIHTNGIESFWAIVKRGIYGIYHHISVKHMQLYMDEFSFRMNHRESEEAFERLASLAVA